MKDKEIGGIGFVCDCWPLDQEKSTIIFIHGSGGNGHFWQAQLEGLSGKVNTVAVDLPGHGGSKGPGKETVEDYMKAVAKFLDDLDAPGPIPCGLSLGGAITQLLLLQYPNRFDAGILIGTGAKLKVLPAIFEAIEKDFKGFVDMVTQFAASAKTDDAVTRKIQDDFLRCRPEVVSGDFKACNQFNVMARLGEICVPVLVISAEDDKLTPPKYADFLESAIPHATRAHLADAGHIAPLEKPQAVNQAIIDFLDQHGL